MIQSNELRIGNNIFYNGNKNEIGVVTEIKQSFDPIIQYVGINGRQDLYYQTKHIKPIPLTEGWLVRFGFFKHNNAYVLEKPKENSINFQFSIWNDFTYNSSEFPIELKHVHELQNLYWVLCGKELTLKQ
jgi:hypothetical protein